MVIHWRASALVLGPTLLLYGNATNVEPARADGAVQGCEQFVKRTDPNADRQLSWGFSISLDPERCMEVAVGQQVTWVGSFGTHPLDAEEGDVPNPIAQHQDGVATFNTPGTFGYVCGFHPVMKGAVRVVAAPAKPVPALSKPVLLSACLVLVAGWLFNRLRRRTSAS